MSIHYYPRPGSGAEQPVSMFDAEQLAQLKRNAQDNKGGTAEQQQIAQQFEALFIQQLLKQARANASGNGLFDSEQVRMTQSMGDEQLSLQLANPGIGLAEALIRQMQGGDAGMGQPDSNTWQQGLANRDQGMARNVDAPSISALIRKLSAKGSLDQVYSAVRGAPEHVRNFVGKMHAAAEAVAEKSGVPMKLLLSQAALESGWGKREILHENGQSTHNLFGIKAGKSWTGKVAHIMTTEFENGEYRKVKQPFRAYDSYEDSLADYARLISTSPRYESVMQAATPQEAAQRVQDAGYATDPNYAQKLIKIMAYFDAGSR
ncbi:flagellar assembly peptidoglycan hydrolase FlgJ [Paenalcaligenes sp. Me131]|uniref:flagellar assembly peptidoglycan hydrolase FlgJ n=1 Tax=Paenalcaligenes sp. Me131 TaxID=3392636 RepID=UPI003D2CBE72